MPRGDQTGPEGMGPQTGREAGCCAGHDIPGHAHPFPRGGYDHGFGHGHGRMRGRGGAPGMGRRWRRFHWRHMHPAMAMHAWHGYGPGWYAPSEGYGSCCEPTPEQVLGEMKQHAEWLQEELEAVSKRIEELEVQGEAA